MNFTYSELVDGLLQEYDYPTRQPGDITPRDMALVSNLTERQWYTILNRKAAAGELQKILVKERGSPRNYFVYRKVEDE